MKKIFFASANAHKLAELRQILPNFDIEIPKSFEADEDGKTFAENALIKAKALWCEGKAPVLADDSGLCIDCLGGAPGIFSARFGSKEFPAFGGKICKSQAEKNDAIVEAVEKAETSRSCRFVCAMCLLFDLERFFVVQEALEGEILSKEEYEREKASPGFAKGGFGYDPIVFVREKGATVANLGAEVKNRISHRAKAAQALKVFVEQTLI